MRVPTSSLPFDSYKTEVILLYNILTLMELRASMAAHWYRIHLQFRRLWFNPWVRKIPQRRKWQPTPVFLPGELHGLRSLADHSSWSCKELDTTEQLTLITFLESTFIFLWLRSHLVKVQSFTPALTCKRSNSTKSFLRVDKKSLIMYH